MAKKRKKPLSPPTLPAVIEQPPAEEQKKPQPEPSIYNHAFDDFDFDARDVVKLMDEGEVGKAAQEILRFLVFFDLMLYNLTELQHGYIIQSIETIHPIVQREDFLIPETLCEGYVRMCVTYSNLCMFSDKIGTTDNAILKVMMQKNNYIRLLFLSSARNNVSLDWNEMFKTSPYFASVWWETVVNSSMCYSNLHAYTNLVRIMSHPAFAEHYQPISPRMTENRMSYLPVFQVTYIDETHEKWLKEIVNKKIKELYRNFEIKNTPNPKKILIISRLYLEHHAMYKAISPMIKSLKGHYHLTLLHLAPKEDRIPVDFFDEVHYAHHEDMTMDTEALDKTLRNNDYGMVIYPDIGMSDSSTVLANQRIAPIQVMCYGHPVSTWGSEIDYIIGGQEAEPHDPQRNYSEKLVMIPGTAAYPSVPAITRTYPEKRDDVRVVSLSWGLIKIRFSTIMALNEAARKSERRIIWRFTGLMAGKAAFFPMCHDLWAVLGKENVEIAIQSDYPDYIKFTEACHFGADSYPFGGNNRIIDNLIAGVPVICWEGDHAYNRFGAALLRKIGLPELIVTSEREYVDLIVRMANDDEFLDSVTKKVNETPIKEIIEGDTSPRYFKDAIDYLFANHERLKDVPGPIIIEGDAA